MSAHKINFYLSASERLQSLFTQAQYLIQLQQTFRKIVPANLAEIQVRIEGPPNRRRESTVPLRKRCLPVRKVRSPERC